MGGPQLENGYLKIANEIFDHFAHFRIPGEVRLVVDAVIRKTYGYQKKVDRISNSQLIEMTGLDKGNLSRSLSSAIEHKIVVRDGGQLSFNKNINEWVPYTKVVKSDNSEKLSKATTVVVRKDNKKLSKKRDTKYNKDNIQKKKSPDPRVKELLDAYQEHIVYPIGNWGKEGRAAKRLIDIGYTKEDVIGCYDALKEQPFWSVRTVDLNVVLTNIGVWKQRNTPIESNGYSVDEYYKMLEGGRNERGG